MRRIEDLDMAINDLLIINGRNWTQNILTPFKVGRHKLWGDDTGRTMDGKNSGTLIGIFPKITVLIYPKNEAEMMELTEVLDRPSQSISYYSARHKTMKSLGTYTNDYEIIMINTEPYYEAIQVSFITNQKE